MGEVFANNNDFLKTNEKKSKIEAANSINNPEYITIKNDIASDVERNPTFKNADDNYTKAIKRGLSTLDAYNVTYRIVENLEKNREELPTITYINQTIDTNYIELSKNIDELLKSYDFSEVFRLTGRSSTFHLNVNKIIPSIANNPELKNKTVSGLELIQNKLDSKKPKPKKELEKIGSLIKKIRYS